MSGIQKKVFTDMCRNHIFQGQGKKNPCKSLHFDNERYLKSLNENFIAERLDDKFFFGICDEDDNYMLDTEEIDEQIEHYVAVVDRVNLEGRKRLNLLSKLFVKFLEFRIPGETPFLRRVISFTVVSVLAIVGENFGDFTPEILWKLLSMNGLLCDHRIVVYAANKLAEDDGNQELRIFNYVDISLFGEFLYYCATITSGGESPMTAIIENTSGVENMLINAISNEITPELGLLTFIIYKNWSSNIDLHFTTREHYIYCPDDLENEMYHFLRLMYCSSLKKVGLFPLLKDYLDLFLGYLGTQICNAGFCFGRGILNLKYFNRFLDYSCSLHHQDFRLMFILNYIHELLLFLHEKDPNFYEGDFKDIPEFLKTRETPSYDCRKFNPTYNAFLAAPERLRSVVAMLMAISHFVDFLLVKEWENRTLRAANFVEIWSELNEEINTRCESIQDFVYNFNLFPFFT